MIRVQFPEPDAAEWRQWCEECDAAHAELAQAHKARQPLVIRPDLYKRFKENVYLALAGPFFGKCAYCEELIYANQFGDIDHFRPKSGLTNEDGSPVFIEVEGVAMEHPGYFWLAYAWDNLLPSCQLCNRPSVRRSGERRIGKNTLFPVTDFRARKPGEEKTEEPLLIHPVQDEPSQHLRIDPSGVLFHLTSRGDAAIRILGLNERGLPDRRRVKYDETRHKMQLLALNVVSDPNGPEVKKILAALKKDKEGATEFSIAARQAITDSAGRIASVLGNLAS